MSKKRQTITGSQPKSKRNGVASALALPCFRQRQVQPRTGRGSYSRKRVSSSDC